jgi:glutathione S-transferase
VKLYYSHRSPYVRLVMVAVHWCGLAERIALMNTIVDIHAPHKLLIRDNPLTKVPTLVLDDGTSIYDSRVICEYLDGCHDGPKLYPAAGPERALALRRQALGVGTIDLLLSWLLERNRPDEGRSQPFIDAVQIKYRAVLDCLEAESRDLASSPFRIGHAAIGTALSYSDFRFGSFDWRTGHDALAAWHAEFLKIPAVAADPFFDDLAAATANKAKEDMAAAPQSR